MRIRRLVSLVVSLGLTIPIAFGQKQEPAGETVRITTELVQTGVVVLDKQGRFVEGLRKDQFILKVDGQQVDPTFFEQVSTGSTREEKLERSMGSTGTLPPAAGENVSYRGRTVIFFIDDLHLSAESVLRARKGISDFVEKEMSLEDQVAVVSPSGQIGFLQRFSDLKPVVRAAVGRITHKPYSAGRDMEQVQMTEYQATRIEQGDPSALDFFVRKLLEATNYRIPTGSAGLTVAAARRQVKNRASLIVRQNEAITIGTLSTLESLMRTAGQLPGRKILFLISDGFFLNERSSGYDQRINRISDAAVRSGIVIYSLDARGLPPAIDASSNRADPEGHLARANVGEVVASQHGLNALAVDSGGKAFFNSSVTDALNEAVTETANYYLLAWRPTSEDQKSPDFKRLEVSIAGRPELTVRLPRGFFGSEPKPDNKPESTSAPSSPISTASSSKPVETALMSALAAPSARTGIPTKLSVSFVDVPGSGPVLTVATQMSTDVLSYGADNKEPAAIDLAGVIFNDQGKQANSFKARINVTQMSSENENSVVVYNHKVPLKPGIYQVRVAARDDKIGLVGSAAQWIEIPDLGSKNLSLATLLLGGQVIGSSNAVTKNGQKEQVQFSVDRRFSRESQMTFFTMIYNAVSSSGLRLESQIEILRGRRRVIASPIRPVVIEPNTDFARIPYGGGVSLKTLSPGRYVLRVTITDRNAGKSASQEILFEVE